MDKEEVGHSSLVGGRFNKQQNYITRLVLVCRWEMSRSPNPLARILKAYKGGLNWVQ